MLREELVFVGTCDIAGHVRGKGFPAWEIEARRHKGVGWTHSNLMQTASGPIFDTPFGTGGNLMIVPDPTAAVRVDFADGSSLEHFFSATSVIPTALPGSAVRARSCGVRSVRSRLPVAGG
jgi:glutamine synthetase